MLAGYGVETPTCHTCDMSHTSLPEGLVAFVKRDCPTCSLVSPVLAELASRGPLTVFSQDDPGFPEGLDVVDDTSLEASWRHNIDTVPTVIAVATGREVDRAVGWDRSQWEELTGESSLGVGLPDHRPGCGSLSVDPEHAAALAVRYGDSPLRSRRVELAAAEDTHEALFDRGWTDGLPVVPPTEERVRAPPGRPTKSSPSSRLRSSKPPSRRSQ